MNTIDLLYNTDYKEKNSKKDFFEMYIYNMYISTQKQTTWI